ncbi:MAG: hypothetical protein JXA19_06555 [Anaerolineales bacterium]|nr:hypothetical protein [Anaerolineales bacterium]
MFNYTGKINNIQLELYNIPTIELAFPKAARLHPGQFFHVQNQEYTLHPLAETLIPISNASPANEEGFIVQRFLPSGIHSWQPGEIMKFRGPLGKGFSFHSRKGLSHMALVELDESPGRLLPLIESGLEKEIEMVLFWDGKQIHTLPDAVEVLPLSQIKETLDWADCCMADIRLDQISTLFSVFPKRTKVDTEVFVHTNMICAGLGECGVCALPGRNNRLVCKDGPVFNLKELVEL